MPITSDADNDWLVFYRKSTHSWASKEIRVVVAIRMLRRYFETEASPEGDVPCGEKRKEKKGKSINGRALAESEGDVQVCVISAIAQHGTTHCLLSSSPTSVVIVV